jgi:hypothetical protein
MSFYFGIGQPPRDSVASPTLALAALPTSKWRKRTARNRPPMRADAVLLPHNGILSMVKVESPSAAARELRRVRRSL